MAAKADLNRREAIGLGLMSGLALGWPRRALGQTPPAKAAAGGRVKNIIFLVADGMSNGVPSLAEPFSQQVRGRGTHWYKLMRAPRVTSGFFETYSLDSLVTDSSAASSAWGSGSRVCNGALNMFPDGTKLTPIAQLVRGTGRRVGLVTTTQMTHATPAGFATNHATRDAHAEIAPQYLDVVDVLMGGGIEYFHKDHRKDEQDLIARYEQGGYAFWDQRGQVTGDAAPEKVLGLFNVGHLPYTLDWNSDAGLKQRVPTLAEMTQKALRILDRHSEGFLLQVEGGRVDHAAHANDAAGIMWDQLAFDDAVGVVLEYVEGRDDTLVIITSDHGNANPGLNGTGARYRDTNAAFAKLTEATHSFEWMAARMAELRKDALDGVSEEVLIELVKTATSIEINKREAAEVLTAFAGLRPGEIFRQHDNPVGMLGQALGNYHGVGWTGVSHTQDLVWISALGPGSERFKGVVKNTDAFGQMLDLVGVSHKNPTMTLEEAQRHRETAAAPATAVTMA